MKESRELAKKIGKVQETVLLMKFGLILKKNWDLQNFLGYEKNQAEGIIVNLY